MSKKKHKKNTTFKNMKEYLAFYSKSDSQKKISKDKYYNLGVRSANLAVEQAST